MAPLIAVTSGEPSGVGPELCLRLAERDIGKLRCLARCGHCRFGSSKLCA